MTQPEDLDEEVAVIMSKIEERNKWSGLDIALHESEAQHKPLHRRRRRGAHGLMRRRIHGCTRYRQVLQPLLLR
jgi:hypothetical protein